LKNRLSIRVLRSMGLLLRNSWSRPGPGAGHSVRGIQGHAETGILLESAFAQDGRIALKLSPGGWM